MSQPEGRESSRGASKRQTDDNNACGDAAKRRNCRGVGVELPPEERCHPRGVGEQILRQRGPLDKGVATGAREELGQPGWQPQELSAGAPATAIAAAVFPAIEAQPAVPKKVAGPAVRKAPAPTAKKEEAKPKQGGPSHG